MNNKKIIPATSHPTLSIEPSDRLRAIEGLAKSIGGVSQRYGRNLGYVHSSPQLPSLELRVPPLVLTIIAGFLGWILAQALPGLNVESAAQAWLAAAIGLLGFICSLLGVAGFRRARTTVNPTKPAAATTLVVSGIYRVTRNPMYVGFLFFLLAELVWLGNPVSLLVAPGFVLYLNRFQIIPEERALSHRFGAEYVEYAARVGRWL